MIDRGPSRTIFVGDVHGCSDPLEALLAALDFDAERDRLLLAGDGFTKGPDPVGVWRIIQRSGAEMVMGNHDAKLLNILEGYLDHSRRETGKPAHDHLLEQVLPIAPEILPWLRRLPLYLDEPGFTLVHAGVHPERGLAGTSRQEFMTIRTWPPHDGLEGPRWHDHYPPGDKPLVFGHDAPGGLVVRRRADGSPYLIGLDTGCVYGGRLTAWILEEDRLVQVPGQADGSVAPPSDSDSDSERRRA